MIEKLKIDKKFSQYIHDLFWASTRLAYVSEQKLPWRADALVADPVFMDFDWAETLSAMEDNDVSKRTHLRKRKRTMAA